MRVGCFLTVLHEAVATGDPELVQLILKYRDHQRYTKRTVSVPELLQKLKDVSIAFCVNHALKIRGGLTHSLTMTPFDAPGKQAF